MPATSNGARCPWVHCCLLVLVFATNNASAQPQLAVSASRTSGTVPLAVLFDATATRGLAGNNYVEAQFEWSFGDPKSPHPGAKGFVVGHVFETPGNHTVQVTVRDATGARATHSLTIEATAPSGPVYCVSASGTDTSCAPGAVALRTMADVQELLEKPAPGRRFLFKRGETFEITNPIRPARDTEGLFFGAYPKQGALPRFEPAGSIEYVLQPHSNVRDWKIVDIELDGKSGAAQALKTGSAGITNLLFLRSKLHHLDRGFNFKGIDNGPLFIVDSEMRDFARHNMYFHSNSLALIGSTIINSGTHNLYLANLYKAFISGNTLGGSSKHDILRISNAGSDEGYNAGDVVVSDNTFYTTNHVWTMLHLGPNSARSCCNDCKSTDDCAQHIRNVLVERNRFGSGKMHAIIGGGYSNLLMRNNIMEVASEPSIVIDDHNSRHTWHLYLLSGTASRDIRIAHNTFVAERAAPVIVVNDWANLGEEFCTKSKECHVEGPSDLNGEPTNHKNISIENNILVSQATTGPAITTQSPEILAEVRLAGNLFYFPKDQEWRSPVIEKDSRPVVADPVFGHDSFRLESSSPAVNAATPSPVFDDFAGAPRDSSPDIGAWEYGAKPAHDGVTKAPPADVKAAPSPTRAADPMSSPQRISSRLKNGCHCNLTGIRGTGHRTPVAPWLAIAALVEWRNLRGRARRRGSLPKMGSCTLPSRPTHGVDS